MKSYAEEFYRQYEQPHIGKLIVGFSGIDPSRKTFSDVIPSELSEEQLSVIEGLIQDYISKLKIRVDSGNIDPEADEPDPFYIDLKPSEIPHEELSGLLGGNTDGHYHLTEAELSKLLKVIDELMPDGENIELPSVDSHEELSLLYGGNTEGHYHLTNEQLLKLTKLIKLFFPNGEPDPVIPDIPGDKPDPAPDPTPEPEPEPEPTPDDPYGGLPRGTPPAWKIQNLPSGYSAYEGAKLYYGDVPSTKTSLNSQVLLVHMQYGTSTVIRIMRTTDGENWELSSNTGSDGWKPAIYGASVDDFIPSFSGSIYKLYALGTPTSNKSIGYFYVNSATAEKTILTLSRITMNVPAMSYTAGCYSSLLDIYIFVSQTGNVARVQNGAVIKNETNEIGMTINPGCAAWSPDHYVFCVTGSEGTATSSTGEEWIKHTEAPHNLVDMSYREDLQCFFARSAEDRMFYVSGDGATWNRLNNTPIPIEEISCVDYSLDLGWYCAIGRTSRNAYFSKDLEHWVGITVTNGAEVEMNSVKYMASVGKYILMPKSGDYYYTFDASAWTDD